MRKDGTGRLRLEITTVGGQFVQFTNIMEMVRQQWTKIGIDLTVQERERSLAEKMAGANQTQMYAWLADGSEHPFTFPDHVFPYNAVNDAAGVLFGLTRGLPLTTCGAIGSLCAAEIISHVGARPEAALDKLVASAGLV